VARCVVVLSKVLGLGLDTYGRLCTITLFKDLEEEVGLLFTA
jgi:hypothetical protein